LSGRGYLLLRRAGMVWGIDNAAVKGLARRDGTFRIALNGQNGVSSLAADEILSVVDGLRVQPVAAVLRRFWPGIACGLAGLAVHGQQPLMVVDPHRPPRLLQLEEKEGTDDERE
jgi:hypothetical protein